MKTPNPTKLIMTAKQMADDHTSWLKTRTMGIGGSDAGAVCGLNPWKSPFQLWLEKTGQLAPVDISDKPSVQAGIRLEPVVADWFQDKTGLKVRRCGMLQSIKDPWMLANVDRLVVGEEVGVEIKTTNAYSGKKWDEYTDSHGMPPSYYLQCLHYMLATGYKAWWMAYMAGGIFMDPICVSIYDANVKDDMELLYQAEKKFWSVNVQQMEMPPLDGSENSENALSERFKGGDEEPIVLDEKAAKIVQKLQKAEEIKKAAEDEIRGYQNELKAQMGDSEFATAQNYWVKWKSYAGRKTFDSKRFEKDFPDLYEKYVKVGKSYRRFSVGEKKDKEE